MNFFYRELGSFEGRTLMIVHGWLGMSEHWLSIGKYLADIGYHVIIPDLPNHGRSFHTDMFSYQSMARFLHDFLSLRLRAQTPKAAVSVRCTFVL